MTNSGRAVIDLKSSQCTDNPTGSDTYPFSNEPTQVVTNTGMERNGGVAAQYEQETTFATAGLQSLITKSGDLLQVDASYNVRINNTSIGNVGGYAVTLRNALKGYQDAAWTAGNTIIGIVKIGQTIRVDEITPATGVVANTRTSTFTIPSVTFTNVVLVKYVGMNFADALQFILSNNAVSYVLSETGSTVSIVGGQTWTARTSPNAQQWNSVAWSPSLGMFAAVSFNGAVGVQIMTSTDGTTWTARTSPNAQEWNSVCWSPALGMFVAVASNGAVGVQVMTSTNGTTWTAATSANAQAWTSVCWSPELGMFAAVAQDGAVAAQIMTSTNGTTWTARTSANAQLWRSVCWSPALGMFVAVAANGAVAAQIMTSTNGTAWSAQTSPSARSWQSVCWSPALGMFVAVAADGAVGVQIMTSTNGTTWVSQASPNAQQWQSVCWSPELGMFAAVAIDGVVGVQIMVSTNGTTWTAQTSTSARVWTEICWSPALGIFAAVAGDGLVAQQIMTSSQIMKGTTLAWKFEATRFIGGNQGVGTFAIGDFAGTMTAITDATWCVIDQFAGTAFSRAILTFPVKKNAANLLTGIGEVGHNQAGTYSATPVYYGVALAAVTVTIGTRAEGPGYAEATFVRSDTGTAIFAYIAPIMQHNTGAWYDYRQSQTQNPALGYGRFNDFFGNSRGATCSLRSVMGPSGTTSAIPSFISAAIIGADATDNLGVPITNVGEYDETFMPHVVDNGSTRLNCIYRYNGVLFFFVIQSASTNTIQAVSDNVYMVNTLSPINAIDVANKTLNLGSNDYNGRFLFRSTAAIITAVQFAAVMQGPYANSVDAGDRAITQTFSTATDQAPGIELPSFVDRAVPQYGVNIYIADLYTTTYQSYNVVYTNSFQSGVLYVPDTRIPLAMGYTFSYHVMRTEIETIFLGVGVTGSADIDYDYLNYEIGNETPGLYQSFFLFGQTYLFDGNDIWLSTFTGSLFSGRGNVPVASATGTQLIAVSPTEAFFLTTFDNSLFSFNGGRSMTKVKRMNDLRNSSNGIETIINGVYNVRDNTLLMQTALTFVWVRDGVVSQTNKKANQTASTVYLYDTQAGIVIANNTLSWSYGYTTRGTTTTTGGTAVSSVVPLTWQSAYHSLKGNELSVAMAWIITVFSPEGPITMPYTLRCHAFDQDAYTLQRVDNTIRPADWDSLGFARMRVQPKNEKALASSIQFDTLQHVVITDVTVLYGDEAQGVIAGARSN